VIRLFADSDRPRVFAAPPGADFARVLVDGLRARLEGQPAEAVARVELTLNTQRARRRVEAAFLEGRAAAWLPRMRTLDAVGAEADLPPAADIARRRLHLTRLADALLTARPDYGPPAAATALAESLGALLDEMQREGVPLDALAGAAPPEHAAHWETTLTFLRILSETWPKVLAEEEGGALDPEARKRAGVEATLAAWAADPPARPMVAAGSTGSVGLTRTLLAAIAQTPQGAVVLPGFDPDRAEEVWDRIGPEHPWRGPRLLLDKLGMRPRDVRPWLDAPGPRAGRRRLLAEALRPAPVTDAWRADRDALAALAPEATAGVTLIEAPDPRREAEAVALLLRESLETPGRTAALVTPDRQLARRVAAALARWGVTPDDSGGRPVALTPPGVFLNLLARAGFRPFEPVALLALLKHPLADPVGERGLWLRAVRSFEVRTLRRRPELRDVAGAAAAHAAWWAEHGPDLPDPLAPALARIAALAPDGDAPLDAMAAAHLDAAQALAPALWDEAAGAAARAAAEGFRAAAPVFGVCPPARFADLFAAALEGEVPEEPFRPDPRVAIWGPLEARMQSADLVILAGLNEGVWPERPGADPWLSRPMREALGLPPPERRVGLAAHDFLQAACGAEVALTRALKADGAPTTPSRWVARLTTLLGGVAPASLEAMRARGAARLALIDPLARPDGPPRPAPRPSPRPPVAARPSELSATQVETLIRDPYALYARKVLRLKPLDPIGREIDGRDRGIALHDALARFLRMTLDGAPPDAATLQQAVDDELASAHAPEALRRLWRARLMRAAPAFLAEEAARREAGAPLGAEIEGAREGDGFRLIARADRIDRRADGTLAIYDYKAGQGPSDSEIRHFARQLPLEAAIAEAGGFEGAPAAPVGALAHIALGGKTAGAARAVGDDLTELVAETWSGLGALIAAYGDESVGYPARARPKRIAYDSDYDHLARHGEWEDGAPAAEDWSLADAPPDAPQEGRS
jgi:ATP-dependent helicase/nuclease subunit B